MTNWLTYNFPWMLITTVLVTIGISPNIAGIAMRAAFAVPFAWAGVIDFDTYRTIAMWSAWT